MNCELLSPLPSLLAVHSQCEDSVPAIWSQDDSNACLFFAGHADGTLPNLGLQTSPNRCTLWVDHWCCHGNSRGRFQLLIVMLTCVIKIIINHNLPLLCLYRSTTTCISSAIISVMKPAITSILKTQKHMMLSKPNVHLLF